PPPVPPNDLRESAQAHAREALRSVSLSAALDAGEEREARSALGLEVLRALLGALDHLRVAIVGANTRQEGSAFARGPTARIGLRIDRRQRVHVLLAERVDELGLHRIGSAGAHRLETLRAAGVDVAIDIRRRLEALDGAEAGERLVFHHVLGALLLQE